MAAADTSTLYSRRSAAGLGLNGVSMTRSGSVDSVSTRNTSSTVSLSQDKLVAPVIIDASKPVCSGNGVSCSIILAEPVIFLKGLDHDGSIRDSSASTGAICRGRLQMNVTKSAKIKAITIKFMGKARTEWPEGSISSSVVREPVLMILGIPPAKSDHYEEESLRTSVIPFFNAMYAGSDTSFGPLCHYALRNKLASSSVTSLTIPSHPPAPIVDRSPTSQSGFSLAGNRSNRSSTISTATREAKRLSLQTNQSRSFQKGDPSPISTGPTPQQRGYKIFHPGVYEYHFEFPMDNNIPETTKLHLASVMWLLEVQVERAGTFKPNLQGFKEIPVIRSPSEDSLELVEPISISRKWEDQLHYEIIISGKSFPIGSKIPIAFKLTPLAKVQVHKLKVYISENIEYFTNNKKVTRKEMARKILLLEKNAGRPLKDFPGSEVKVLSGGEPDAVTRVRAREIARRQREREAAQTGTEPKPLPDPVDNMLGDLDLGLEGYWGQTEIEMNVQLPTCETMAKDRSKELNHACTWKNANVHHWIKIVMRISRADAEDPAGKKRRHFEISIDSPLTILNCRATQANLALPQYSNLNANVLDERQVCGCPNAAPLQDMSPTSSTDSIDDGMGPIAGPETAALAHPPQAHPNSNTIIQRPMHMLRNPSYNPPAFDAEEPPPPMPTPPPLYDHIIGTPSVDGLADYFARYVKNEACHVMVQNADNIK